MIIEQATIAHIACIRHIAMQTFPATYRDILTRGQIDYMMELMYSEESLRQQMIDGHIFLLGTPEPDLLPADEEPTPVGYVSVEPQTDECYHLQKLYVLPSQQGRGYGESLFLHALSLARNKGARRVELNVNRHNRALSFYERMGMYKAGEGDFDIGNGYYMNDYIMAIDL